MENHDSTLPNANNANPYPYDTAHVSELLKRKRRVRGIKSCFPCRHRKVRCDGSFPCVSCLKRGHPELCRLPGRGNDVGGEITSPGEGVSEENECNHGAQHASLASHDQSNTQSIDHMIARLSKIEDQISSLKADLLQTRTASTSSPPTLHPYPSVNPNPNPDLPSNSSKSSGKHFVEDATGATIFLGSHSDIPAALGCRQPSRDMALTDALVLDQLVPRTYPFTSLWGPEAGTGEICMTLPDDSDIIRYWQVYQTSAYPFYPGLVTFSQFEAALFAFLDQRANASRGNELSALDDVDPSWLALLFAVLAGGVQFSDDPIKERDLRSKVFICSSFQCLRISNFFNNTDINQIQAMALIGHCLRNNLDTNSAWILMGATMRLAQSIGLHEENSSPESSADHYHRRRLWWILLWQDTFLSFTYDRPPSTITHSSSIPHNPESKTKTKSGYTFAESIFALCQILLDRARHQPTDTLTTTTLAYKHRIQNIWNDAAPFLIDKSACRTLQDHLERLALHVHINYGVCRLTRLILESVSDSTGAAAKGTDIDIDIPALKTETIQHAADAVSNFLDMHRLSANVCRSWAFVHNAVSFSGRWGSGGEYAGLVGRLIGVLEKEERMSSWEDADANVRCFGPYSRALRALRESELGGFGVGG
ncbi:fungal-specific transcription factor domain-containing protein [Penicillium daleae]|uniref:Fungal-specific transcription factor domain-containing protein n=1 Tax=Penicillium daleae TaxID=63821 RepID=A0AAD6BVX2_9EURO|nr:fungal-specific transcription factor domain-containing protein [Penicillium daleae]KAJ5432327.1 fungal-specific transcription factor domain-containing protein [Penicillium daleae]